MVLGLVTVAVGIGAAGYHYLANLSWLDAALNAAMILTGMGPVNQLVTPAAKVFAIGYALFSGVFFLSMVAVLLAPAANLFMHRFHLEVAERESQRKDQPLKLRATGYGIGHGRGLTVDSPDRGRRQCLVEVARRRLQALGL